MNHEDQMLKSLETICMAERYSGVQDMDFEFIAYAFVNSPGTMEAKLRELISIAWKAQHNVNIKEGIEQAEEEDEFDVLPD